MNSVLRSINEVLLTASGFPDVVRKAVNQQPRICYKSGGCYHSQIIIQPPQEQGSGTADPDKHTGTCILVLQTKSHQFENMRQFQSFRSVVTYLHYFSFILKN